MENSQIQFSEEVGEFFIFLKPAVVIQTKTGKDENAVVQAI